MAYKTIITGSGFEDFSRADRDGVIRSSDELPGRYVQVEDVLFRYKNHRMARIDPDTRKRTGPIRKPENVLKGKGWKVEYQR